MSKNPYEILGVSPSASREEIDEAYYYLRDKYRLDMHSEGDKGKQAARALNDLETAYRDIIIDYTGESSYTAESAPESDVTSDPVVEESSFGEVDRLIRDKKYPEAQKALDNIFERNAEWHYYQSVIYYKQGWLNESKSQLEIACNMEPSNTKYTGTLNKLNAKLNASKSTTNPSSTHSGDGYSRSYGGDYDARRAEDSCCQACQTAICLNCLCDCCCRS